MRPRYLLAAIVYGLLIYFIAGDKALGFLLTLLSVAFLFGGPFAIGYLTAKGMQASTPLTAALAPLLPLGVILGVLLAIGSEGAICVVMAFPFLVAGAASGGLFAHLRRKRNGGNGELGAVLLLPMLLTPLEQRLDPRDQFAESVTSVVIAATPERVWDEIAEVDSIGAAERGRALYTTIGFPPPIAATLDVPQEGGIRRASFGGGVLFTETITEWEPHQALGFAIDPSFDEGEPALDPHVRIGGEYFDVLSGRYVIEPVDSAHVRLVLISHHRVSTRFNSYAGWWSDRIMRSVQENILEVIRARAEDVERPAKERIRAATTARLARESSAPREADSFESGFSIVGRLSGRTDVYADSVVVLVPDGVIAWPRLSEGEVHDSSAASLAMSSGASWTQGAQGPALRISRAVRGDSLPLGPMRRFTIPRAPGESLEGRWVVFTHFLTVPKTADNPYGTAWTYTHAGR